MKVIRGIDESGMSRDYERLFELIQTQSIICILDYKYQDWRGNFARRCVAWTEFHLDQGRMDISVGAGPVKYIWAKSKERFLEDAESFDLAFVDPGATPDKHQWIRAKVDELLDAAIAESTTRFNREAINWGDLEVVRVLFCQDDENKWSWMVEIEELDADCPELREYLLDGMKALGIDNIELRFHW